MLTSQDDLKSLSTSGLLASVSQIQGTVPRFLERFINCYIAMPVQMPEQCSPMKNLTEVNEPGVHLGSICLISTWTSDLSNLWNSSIAKRVDLGCVFPMGPSPAHRELQPLQANLFTATSLNSDIYLNCFFYFMVILLFIYF